MAIRLTENRLRQIIREEASSLTRRRRFTESADLASQLRAAYDVPDYDEFINVVFSSDPRAARSLTSCAKRGDGPKCVYLLRKFMDMAGIESEDEVRVLDALSKRLGVGELDTFGGEEGF